MKTILGISYSQAYFQTFSVSALTPEIALTITTAPSTAFRVPLISSTKFINPGVSIRFILWPFQLQKPRADIMVIFLDISSGSESVVVLPSSMLPSLSIAPESKSIASTRDVFPAPPCAITATLRILLTSKLAIKPLQLIVSVIGVCASDYIFTVTKH